VAALSGGLRIWQLNRFDALVFDEVYFVQFAQNYLSGAASFDAHPPLGKYLIAAGIWLYQRFPLPNSAASYRWLTALVGSALPLVVMALANALGKRFNESNPKRLQTFALLSGLFVTIDGLFVVESRYGLINIYMVFFGLLGQWLWLRQDEKPHGTDVRLQVLSAVSLGGAIAIKWNGLGFVLSLIGWELISPKKNNRLRKTALWRLASRIGIISSATYIVVWIPHLWATQESFWATHASLLSFHQQLPAEGHSACSRWFTWPLLIKPIAYWYQESDGLAHTVNNLGNPLLWWLSSAAVLLMFVEKLLRALARKAFKKNNPLSPNLATLLLIGYGANWLPWAMVNRCTFIYLYMPAAIFSFMALAWMMSGWLQAPTSGVRMMGWAIGIAIALAFCFWLPLSLGSPLTPESLQLRWWLRTWI